MLADQLPRLDGGELAQCLVLMGDEDLEERGKGLGRLVVVLVQGRGRGLDALSVGCRL